MRLIRNRRDYGAAYAKRDDPARANGALYRIRDIG
jgi:hypothetical protein